MTILNAALPCHVSCLSGTSPAAEDTWSTYESVPVLLQFLSNVLTNAVKHRPSEEAGWVIWNFWLGVTGKLFNVIKNSVCRSFLSKQGQCWQSRDAFLLQMFAAGGWRRAALGRQRFRAVNKDAQWHLLVSLQQCLCLQAFWRQWSRLVVLLLCSATVGVSGCKGWVLF